MREADALEARRQQSQKALEAAQRQRELEFEHKRAAEAKARENAERLARDAAERLEAMRSQWRESSALQQVPPPILHPRQPSQQRAGLRQHLDQPPEGPATFQTFFSPRATCRECSTYFYI